ncbi:MAG: gp208 [uncultured marine phage]|uniref:Gp208 n=1 Tax=uncultured marine phage TaxID=707152 RepID=A0A8D9CBW3_9VIRU|nr:MAG: gp208 [uncultured marine phage]
MYIKFQIFGSESSLDLDCMCFVDEIPSIQESHDLCDKYTEYIQDITKTDKEINTNICVIKKGIVVETFKGTADEVNNSLYLTYDLHDQHFPLMISRLIPRDVELKILRTCRVILSFWSRSEFRPQVKSALRGDIYQKMETLKIKFEDVSVEKRNVKIDDYFKVMAFQLGQTIGLIDGIELYSKESIMEQYPDLEPFLMRRGDRPFDILEKYKTELLSKIKDRNFIQTKDF